MAGEQTATACATHPEQTATGTCAGCGKPVCRECAKQFGYYCSQSCLERGRLSVADASRQRARRNEEDLHRGLVIGKALACLAVLVVTAGVLGVLWRFWLDPAGKVCWQWTGSDAGQSRILGVSPRGITVLVGKTVVVLDPMKGRESSVFVLPERPVPADAGAGDALDDWDGDDHGGFHGFWGRFQVLNDGSLLCWDRKQIGCVDRTGTTSLSRDCQEGYLGHLAVAADGTRAFAALTMPEDPAVARQAQAALRQAQAELPKDGQGWYNTAAAGDDVKIAAVLKRIQTARAQLAQTRTSIACIDLHSGKDLWASPKLRRGVSITSLAAGTDAVLAVFMNAPGEERGTAGGPVWGVMALAAADGGRLWVATLPEMPEWGPVPCGELTLVQVAGDLLAFRNDGSTAWTSRLPERGRARPLVQDGVILLLGDSASRCLDPATGKEKWGVLLEAGIGDIVVGKRRVYLSGQVEEALAEKDMKLPPAYQELEKMPELKGILEQARKKLVPMVVAVDRESGEEVWRLRNAYGRLLGDDDRLVLVADTAETSLLEAATGGKGVTLIRQINPRNGKQLILRQSSLGFAEPTLIGKRIVGVAYERQERPSVFNPGAGMDSGPPKRLGIAAYRVK